MRCTVTEYLLVSESGETTAARREHGMSGARLENAGAAAGRDAKQRGGTLGSDRSQPNDQRVSQGVSAKAAGYLI